jgi:hypothetical protein
VISIPVTLPAIAPATIDSSMPLIGSPLKACITDTATPRVKVPSTDRSGISSILNEMNIPSARIEKTRPFSNVPVTTLSVS